MSAKISTEEEATIYECAFDFMVSYPKKSQIIGKDGVIELTSDEELSEQDIEKLKTDENLLHNIGFDLSKTLKTGHIFSVTIKSITLKK